MDDGRPAGGEGLDAQNSFLKESRQYTGFMRQVFREPDPLLEPTDMFDTVTLATIGLLTVSAVVFYFIARFTVNLIRQHYNVYDLMYLMEEEEKKE